MAVFNCKNADDVLKAVKDYNVSFIQFWFIDVLGVLKSFQITPGNWKTPSKKAWASTAPPSPDSPKSRNPTWWPSRTPPPSKLVAWRPSDRPWPGFFAT